MRGFYIFIFLFSTILLFSQEKGEEQPRKSLVKTAEQKAKEKAEIAPITAYKIITLQRDTTLVDTTLSIKKEYDYNYLRKDIFGLMPFPNEGQTYSTLNFGLHKFNPFPEFGFKGKHFNYLEVDDIKYYSVATPFTDLYYKTVMGQGQNVDAFITLNTSENLNFSAAYKGLHSQGKYVNQLVSSGNFRFTSSYLTSNKRYGLNAHFTGQDLKNGENGGLTTPEDFESKDNAYSDRARLQVFLTDAQSMLKGKRVFIDHFFRINPKDAENNLYITHQFNYEHKFFEYYQVTLNSFIGNSSPAFQRFGTSSVTSNMLDRTYNNKFFNRVGAAYENKTLGKFQFFIENFNNRQYYDAERTVGGVVYPSQIKSTISTIGGQYAYRKDKWNGSVELSNSVSVQPMRNFDAHITYTINTKNNLFFQYQNISKSPNNTYLSNQSSYDNYNWNNSFKNEKINALGAYANTQWLSASVQLTTLDDHLYFEDIQHQTNLQLVTPHQFTGTINYLSVKLAKEFVYKKWAFDNTFLYQKVSQNDNILNVPELTFRNTLYFSDYVFKRAMFLQTGLTLNYFTKYFADDYNPVLAEFFVQRAKQIGNFPMFDFFVNARIRQTRIYLKAEHFNSSFSKTNSFYSAPTTPYRDFTIRFGLVWNFFR